MAKWENDNDAWKMVVAIDLLWASVVMTKEGRDGLPPEYQVSTYFNGRHSIHTTRRMKLSEARATAVLKLKEHAVVLKGLLSSLGDL